MLRELQEVVARDPWPARLSRPSISDLAESSLPRGDLQIVETALELFGHKSVALLHGPPNSGKTFLALGVAAGYCRRYSASRAFYAGRMQFQPNDAQLIRERSAANATQRRSLFVIDDVEDADPEWLAPALEAAIAGSANILLVSTQPVPSTQELLELWPAQEDQITRRRSRDLTTSILRRFLARSGQRAWVNDAELESFADLVGGDLDRAVHSAAAWVSAGSTGRMDAIDDDSIASVTAREYGLADNTLEALSAPVRARFLYRLAILNELRLPAPIGGIPDDELSTLASIGSRVQRVPRDGPPALYLEDEKAGRWIKLAVERLGISDLPTLGDCLWPLARQPETVRGSLRRVADLRHESLLKTFLLDDDVDKALDVAIPNGSVRGVLRLAAAVRECLRPEDRWLVNGLVQRCSPDQLVLATKGISATSMRKFLPLLSRAVDLNYLFACWVEDDWLAMANSANANVLRLLLFDMRHFRLSSAQGMLAGALNNADWSRIQAVSLDPRFNRDVTGLIGNVVQDAPTELRGVLENFARYDQSLYLRNPWGLADLGWLLNHMLNASPTAGEAFLRRHWAFIEERLVSDESVARMYVLAAAYRLDQGLALQVGRRMSADLQDPQLRPWHKASYEQLLLRCGSSAPPPVSGPWTDDEILGAVPFIVNDFVQALFWLRVYAPNSLAFPRSSAVSTAVRQFLDDTQPRDSATRQLLLELRSVVNLVDTV